MATPCSVKAIGAVPPNFPRVGITVCDTRVLISAVESSNMKSDDRFRRARFFLKQRQTASSSLNRRTFSCTSLKGEITASLFSTGENMKGTGKDRRREARYALFLAWRLVRYRLVGSAVRLVDAFSLVSKTTRT
jgi:hypothetical protein